MLNMLKRIFNLVNLVQDFLKEGSLLSLKPNLLKYVFVFVFHTFALTQRNVIVKEKTNIYPNKFSFNSSPDQLACDQDLVIIFKHIIISQILICSVEILQVHSSDFLQSEFGPLLPLFKKRGTHGWLNPTSFFANFLDLLQR